jgi:transposase
MKAYSLDFRTKIIEVWQEEKLSIRKLAKHFKVTTSFIQKLIKQYQETGDLNPLPRGGGNEPKINGENLVTLMEILEENNDATLRELCDLLEEKTGVRVEKTTMGKVLNQLEYRFKKKHCMQQKRQVK